MKIGIITRTDRLDQTSRIFINESYIKKITSYSHTPIPLYDDKNAEEMATYCDGLIIPGGYDIAPFYFHEPFDDTCTFYEDQTQDIRDFRIIDAFVKKGKPILGICRGIQLLNVYFAGSLHQNIDMQKHEQHHKHRISITPNTFLSSCMPNHSSVNSYHHQVIAKVGKCLQVCATSYDGYIEAVQHDFLPIIAVQWHPELMDHDLIFPYFFHMLTKSLS